MDDILLDVQNLTHCFRLGRNRTLRALDGVSFQLRRGEIFGLVGESGSGKSTLLHMLGGLDRPTSGQVAVDGKVLSSLKDEALTIFRRRKIGFVFQNYNLVPVLNVYENIVLPLQLDGRKPDQDYLHRIIETLGLEQKLHSLPNNLSGGQQQRVAIARALAAKPAIILADEPTGNLDSKSSREVMELLTHAAHQYRQTILMITHNMKDAIAYGDRLIMMYDGRIAIDVSGEEKKKLTVPQLLELFSKVSGSDEADDKLLLS